MAGSLLLSSSQVLALEAKTDSAKGEIKKMKIVLLTGSPRKNGNTNHMADQFERGAKESGHEIFRFNAAESEVHPCVGCNRCGMNGPCIFTDDFTKRLRPELVRADLIVFCSPMYYFGFSTQLKSVIDRFYAINGQLHAKKKAAFLMAYANQSKKRCGGDDRPLSNSPRLYGLGGCGAGDRARDLDGREHQGYALCRSCLSAWPLAQVNRSLRPSFSSLSFSQSSPLNCNQTA